MASYHRADDHDYYGASGYPLQEHPYGNQQQQQQHNPYGPQQHDPYGQHPPPHLDPYGDPHGDFVMPSIPGADMRNSPNRFGTPDQLMINAAVRLRIL